GHSKLGPSACGATPAERSESRGGLEGRRPGPFILRGPAFGRAPQRLCSFSSGLPLFFVPEHGVEDGHDLPSDGDEGHHFRLTLSEQALVEGTQHWIAADGGKRRQEDGRTGSWAAAANHALAFPLAGSARTAQPQ